MTLRGNDLQPAMDASRELLHANEMKTTPQVPAAQGDASPEQKP
jgi:hypothetical protein